MNAIDEWVEWTTYGVIGILVASLVLFLFAEATADRFSLKKADWKCTDSREEKTTTVLIIDGKIYPNTYTKTVCYQWTHK